MSEVIVNPQKIQFSEKEFLAFSSLTPLQLSIWVKSRRLTVRECMEFRRALQVALKHYSRTHPKMDNRMMNVLGMCMQFENRARLTYMYFKMKEMARHYPQWSRTTRKIEAKRQWEHFVRVNSF